MNDAEDPDKEWLDRWLDKSPWRAILFFGLLGIALVALTVLNMIER